MQLLPNRITLKEESNLLSLRNSANPMSIWWSRDLEEGLSLFISWLFGIPYPNHWLSVNRSDLQANHRNSLDVLRAYRGYARMCDGDTVLTLQGTRDKAKVSGWRGQKRGGGGGGGWKDCWKPSGKPSCRKCRQQNCRRKTVSQLLLGRLAKEERPRRGWGEPLWD